MAFHEQTDRGMETHGLFDDGAEIWQGGRGYFVAYQVSQPGLFVRSEYFLDQPFHACRVAAQEVNNGSKRNGSRVTSRKDVGGKMDYEVSCVHLVRIRELDVRPSRKHIPPFNIGVDEFAVSFDRGATGDGLEGKDKDLVPSLGCWH